MKRYISVQLPTAYADVRPYYIEEEDTLYIVGWLSEDFEAGGQALATIKIDTKPILTWYNSEAEYDGLAQAIFIQALDSIEEGTYKQYDRAKSCIDAEG